MNSSMMREKEVLRPNWATNHAASNWLAVMVAINAVDMNCAVFCPTPYAPITSGMETFTMVPPSTMVNPEIRPVNVAASRWRGLSVRLNSKRPLTNR